MGFKILAINPGSTSTKVALYDEERPSLDLTLRHTAEQIARYTNIIDQLGWRREMILTALSVASVIHVRLRNARFAKMAQG